jgi:hypothetical protein
METGAMMAYDRFIYNFGPCSTRIYDIYVGLLAVGTEGRDRDPDRD